MVLGFLFRSGTWPSTHPKHKTKPNPPKRRGPIDYAGLWCEAEDTYKREEAHIMREEIRMRNRNDIECKRQMDMIEKNKQAKFRELQEAMNHEEHVLLTQYRAAKFDHHEYHKRKAKLKRTVDARCASCIKQYREDQAKAQRIFFSRGEEIGANTGAALRRAKEKLQYGQRIKR